MITSLEKRIELCLGDPKCKPDTASALLCELDRMVGAVVLANKHDRADKTDLELALRLSGMRGRLEKLMKGSNK